MPTLESRLDRLQMGKAGIPDRLPKLLGQKNADKNDVSSLVTVYDENGKEFDDLRGKGSISQEFGEYLGKNGGSAKWWNDWGNEQGGGSWNERPMAAKFLVAESRNVSHNDYWWGPGSDGYAKSMSLFRKFGQQYQGEDRIRDTMAAQHALTIEILERVRFVNNDRRQRVVKLMRVEKRDVMTTDYGLSVMPSPQIQQMPRGPLESTSSFNEVEIGGSDVRTEQFVPYTRIMATYLLNRGRDFDHKLFYGDNESEFMAVLEGLGFRVSADGEFSGNVAREAKGLKP